MSHSTNRINDKTMDQNQLNISKNKGICHYQCINDHLLSKYVQTKDKRNKN